MSMSMIMDSWNLMDEAMMLHQVVPFTHCTDLRGSLSQAQFRPPVAVRPRHRSRPRATTWAKTAKQSLDSSTSESGETQSASVFTEHIPTISNIFSFYYVLAIEFHWTYLEAFHAQPIENHGNAWLRGFCLIQGKYWPCMFLPFRTLRTECANINW